VQASCIKIHALLRLGQHEGALQAARAAWSKSKSRLCEHTMLYCSSQQAASSADAQEEGECLLVVLKDLLAQHCNAGPRLLQALVTLAHMLAVATANNKNNKTLLPAHALLIKTVIQEALRVWKGLDPCQPLCLSFHDDPSPQQLRVTYFDLMATLARVTLESHGFRPDTASGTFPPQAYESPQVRAELWRCVAPPTHPPTDRSIG
jgi:hypothetical protein